MNKNLIQLKINSSLTFYYNENKRNINNIYYILTPKIIVDIFIKIFPRYKLFVVAAYNNLILKEKYYIINLILKILQSLYEYDDIRLFKKLEKFANEILLFESEFYKLLDDINNL